MIKTLGRFLYPNVCLYCNATGADGLDLCHRCYASLPWVAHACTRCALPLPTSSSTACGACSNRDLYFDQAFTPFLFAQFVREAVYQFKFHNKLNYGKLLAELFLRHLQKQNLTLPDILIPVPLHRRRLRKRGFNQALELARGLGKQINRPVSYKDIQRVRETHVQMELSAKNRYVNVKDAFKLRESKSSFKDQHVVIVDDVMTTGNTVNEVAKCLRKADAKCIDVWCIARVT